METQRNPPPPLSDTRFLFDAWFPAYGPDARTGSIPPGHLSMAEAVHRICRRLLVSYDRDFPLLATLPSLPVIAAELAFVGDEPVPGVQERYAPTMRAVDALCTLAGGSLLSQDDEVWRVIGSDRFADPHPLRDWDGFVSVFGSGGGLQRGDWNHLLIEIGGWRSIGTMARRVLLTAAEVLVPLATRGAFDTVASPMTGPVDAEPISREQWNTADGLRRLATGGFDPTRPHQPGAAATHDILVRESGFEEAIAEPCSAKEIDPAPHIARMAGGRAYPYADLLSDLVSDMALLLAQDAHRDWRSNHLRMALPGLDRRYANLDDGIFRKARETLFDLGIEKIGRWSDGRPSRAEADAVESLRDRKFDREGLIRVTPAEILRKLPQPS
ncbi:MAG: hypothetical protein PGN23_06740 [Sphingomonas adhaesiva]|uniref:hypothetical protein n=1 Tax=Sphingomonas adhaesiva TaxID=28212 RepID=UPI002FFD00BB